MLVVQRAQRRSPEQLDRSQASLLYEVGAWYCVVIDRMCHIRSGCQDLRSHDSQLRVTSHEARLVSVFCVPSADGAAKSARVSQSNATCLSLSYKAQLRLTRSQRRRQYSITPVEQRHSSRQCRATALVIDEQAEQRLMNDDLRNALQLQEAVAIAALLAGAVPPAARQPADNTQLPAVANIAPHPQNALQLTWRDLCEPAFDRHIERATSADDKLSSSVCCDYQHCTCKSRECRPNPSHAETAAASWRRLAGTATVCGQLCSQAAPTLAAAQQPAYENE